MFRTMFSESKADFTMKSLKWVFNNVFFDREEEVTRAKLPFAYCTDLIPLCHFPAHELS